MIEGLKVTVQGAEVAELALKQAAFHSTRAAFYGKQVAMYADQQAGNPGMQYMSSNQDPKAAATQKQTEHAEKASHLEFVAAHIKPSEEYLLDNQALATLGVLKSNRFF